MDTSAHFITDVRCAVDVIFQQAVAVAEVVGNRVGVHCSSYIPSIGIEVAKDDLCRFDLRVLVRWRETDHPECCRVDGGRNKESC